MPAGNDTVIKKPKRGYPLPTNIRDLDYPWRPQILANRHARVSQFADGYDVGSGEDPTIVKPAISKSDLLNKM